MDYRYAPTVAGTDAPTATATLRPDLPLAGRYNVYVWYSQGVKRSRKAKYQVVHDEGSLQALVNQVRGGGRWQLMGRQLKFAEGTNGFVRLSHDTGEPDSVVIADGVRFVCAPE